MNARRKGKKSQIEMGETVAVLIIFFIMLVLAFTYFIFIKAGESTDLLQEKEAKQSIKVTQEATFLSELACTHEGVVQNDCVDLRKLNAFQEVRAEAGLLYFDKLGYSKVKVFKTYPDDEKDWLVYETLDPKRSATRVTQIPISILSITNDGFEQYMFGYLEVTYYYIPV